MNSILENNGVFTLNTENTTYSFGVKHGILVHYHYGEKLSGTENVKDFITTTTRPFNAYFKETGRPFVLNSVPLEISFKDYGDFRTPSASIKGADGHYISDFRYDGFEISDTRREITGLPFGRNGANSKTLSIILKSLTRDVIVRLNYTVYPDIDVIIRNMEVENRGEMEITVERATSALLDINKAGLKMLTLQGIPANERKRHIQDVPFGRYCLSSVYGSSGSFGSPFCIVAEQGTDENHGTAYGFNLVYSGNFAVETYLDDYLRTRVNIGINPEFFAYTLGKDKTFASPEAILTYSNSGYNGVSIAFADYIRNYIYPERYAFGNRPVVINTWEALVFDINEQKLLDFADCAVKAGMDILVIDDGWFSTRRWDDKGLGDWYVADCIFPNGLKSFSEKIYAKGIKLGIWIEPEMVNPDSDLFRAHPEWALGDGDKILSRDQLVLDMTNPEVVDYLFDAFKKVFDGVKLSYIKWDMNRCICPFLSAYTPNDSEVAHKYILGVYDLMDRMTKHFKDVIFESCSGGGGRYDVGMLQYTPQIWTSDNTDAFERSYIQAAASYFTPISAMSCHVTRPFNIGTRLGTSMDFRYGMAINGVLGYEFNLFDFSDKELAEIKAQITEYKTYYQDLVIKGDFYRLVTPFESNIYAYNVVAKDKKTAFVCVNVIRNGRNFPDIYLNIYGLDDNKNYLFDGKVLSGKFLRVSGIRLPEVECSGQTFKYFIKEVE